VPPLTRDEYVAQAVALAGEIQQRAIRTADTATWIELEYILAADQFQLRPMDAALYHGISGVSLFLAALEHVTGGAGFHDLALAAATTLARQVQGPNREDLLKEHGIGGASGVGSLVYALTRTGQWLDEPRLVAAAHQAAALIRPDKIAADTRLDVMGGSAGALLGLLAVYQATGDAALLAQAVACGEHLLAARVAGAGGLRSWPDATGALLTGFSHGAAGTAYALLRLYAVTQDTRYHEAAAEAIAYEDSVFVPDAGNWPDLRAAQQPADGTPVFMTTWCHGAPGIGLARLGGLAWLDSPAIRADIAAALATTQAAMGRGIEHLCCGNFGRIDVLLAAAQRLDRPDLLAAAHQQAAQGVARAAQAGHFYLAPHLPNEMNLIGFFQGTAGIGYELLRLAHPTRLPAILLWD
jgi:type 2 lantibiotic biosynthesis protein LanM